MLPSWRLDTTLDLAKGNISSASEEEAPDTIIDPSYIILGSQGLSFRVVS